MEGLQSAPLPVCAHHRQPLLAARLEHMPWQRAGQPQSVPGTAPHLLACLYKRRCVLMHMARVWWETSSPEQGRGCPSFPLQARPPSPKRKAQLSDLDPLSLPEGKTFQGRKGWSFSGKNSPGCLIKKGKDVRLGRDRQHLVFSASHS